MGTLFLAYVIWLFGAIFVLVIKRCKKQSKRIEVIYERMKNKLFYNGFISLFVESYSLIAVCCLINLSYIHFSSFGQGFHSTMCLTFTLLILFWPLHMFNILTRYFKNLQSKAFIARYGSLYEEINIEEGSRMVLIQPAFFLFRRLLLAVAVVIFDKVLIWQIMLMALQIVASVIIIGNVRPFHTNGRSKKELFNEIVLMFVMYTIICFSPFVPDVTVRFYIGYITIFVVSLHLAINIYEILQATIRQLIRKRKLSKA